MNKIYRMSVALLVCLAFFFVDASAKKEFVKEINKEFSLNKDGDLHVENRHGDVTVKTWDKASAVINVRITVNARNQSQADDVFDRIQVNFNASDDFVGVETEISQKNRVWSFFNFNTGSDYRVDMEIFMPETADLRVQNKYGDVTTESLKGDMLMQVSYGNYKIESVLGHLKTELAYGNGVILSCADLDAEIKYSKLRVKSCSSVHMESKYSKVTIEESEDVRINSKYDDYEIWSAMKVRVDGKYDHYELESVHSFEAYGKYSAYDIEELTGTADLQMEYGEAKFDQIDKNFEEILVRGKYTTFRFDVEEGGAYSVDMSGKYTGVRYPNSFQGEEVDIDGTDKTLKGYIGSSSTGARIKARTEYGNFIIK